MADYIPDAHIYKIVTKTQYEQLKKHKMYSGNDSDQKDGFIHLCLAKQCRAIIDKYYDTVPDLILLKVPVDKLGPALKMESNRPGGTQYPHHYEDLETDLIIDVIELSADRHELENL